MLNKRIDMFTEQIIQEVWERATIVKGYNETTIRKDSCGAWIIRSDYGNMNSIYGWEIDHIYPKEKGGKDDIDNLRALQWENNRSKKDDYPVYSASVQAEGNRNEHKERQLSVNQLVQERLRELYGI